LINVEDGQTARVLTVAGNVMQIELLAGDHAGEHAWIRMTNLEP